MWPRYKERSIKASAERKVDRTGLQWLYDCLLTCGNEIYSRPLEDTDFVVVVDAEEVHGHEEDGDQHGDEGQCVEELGRHHEGWNNKTSKY